MKGIDGNASADVNNRATFASSDESIIPNHSRRVSKVVERDAWYSAHKYHGWGPFWRQLRLFTGRKSDESLWKILLRPFPLFLHPAVAWGSLTQGTLIAFLVAVSSVIALIFGGPPNFFSDTKVGYFYVGPFLGGMVGFVFAGLLSDFLCRVLTKVNNNVFEPEFRIVLVGLQIVGAAIGLFPFGISADEPWSYYVSILLFAFVTFALIMGATATGTYIVDAHHEMAVEAFVCITLFKNFVAFGMTMKVVNILINEGDVKVISLTIPNPLFPAVLWRLTCFFSSADLLYSWGCPDGSLSIEYSDVYLWKVFSSFLCQTRYPRNLTSQVTKKQSGSFVCRNNRCVLVSITNMIHSLSSSLCTLVRSDLQFLISNSDDQRMHMHLFDMLHSGPFALTLKVVN